jgi:hypothetical protein
MLKRRTCLTILATLALASLSLLAHAQTPASSPAPAPQKFTQDRFVIGYWNTPPNDANLPARFQEIADAHFNLIIAGGDGPSAAAELALCKKHDIRAIFWHNDPGLMADPNVWGWAIRDEPGGPNGTFESLVPAYQDFKKKHPAKLGYINLYPDYANAEQLGTPSYEEHVTKYMTLFKPEVLCMDHYPQFHAAFDQRGAYCNNLASMRNHSLKAGIPFWNFFNTMPYGPHTDPTEAQLRWQINASLVYGAKGVLYFCYFTPRGAEFPLGGAIIDVNGKKTRHYAQAQRINAELKNLGPALMQLTSQHVTGRIQGMEAAGETLAKTPLKKITNAYPKETPLDLQIGSFSHADGSAAALIQNYSYTHTAWITVEFNADHAKVTEIDKATGKPVPLYDESPDTPGMQISFDAGDARLFVIPK